MADERSIWERIKDGAWAAITAIPSALMWTAGLFGASYAAGKLFKNEKADFLGVEKAVTSEHPLTALAQNAALPLGISALVSGGLATIIKPQNAAEITAPSGIPLNNPEAPGRAG